MTTHTVTYTELKGGDTLADGDYVLSATWGKSRARALVVEVQHPDTSTGRRYFADDAAIEVLTPTPAPAEVLSTSNAGLITALKVLTHRLHEYDPADNAHELRAQRDAVEAEVVRRMALGWEARA